MSYYQADYYRNPVPYTSSDVGEPVPGWGVNLRIAGPRRVGVGAIVRRRAERPAARQRSPLTRVTTAPQMLADALARQQGQQEGDVIPQNVQQWWLGECIGIPAEVI
jgi:hypothetical protein